MHSHVFKMSGIFLRQGWSQRVGHEMSILCVFGLGWEERIRETQREKCID